MTQRPPSTRWPVRPVVSRLVAAVLVAGSVLAGCSSSGDDGSSTTGSSPGGTSPSTATSTTATSTTAIPTTATSTTTTTEPASARWVGTVWVGAPEGGGPLVDGAPTGLTSVAGLCQDSGCQVGLDLLTAQPVDGAPAPGPYLLWANRVVDRTDDGRAVWEITDARDLTLPAGSTTYVCAPTSDLTVQVLGFGPVEVPEGDRITPDAVWLVDEAGSIATPDPAGYSCDVGQD